MLIHLDTWRKHGKDAKAIAAKSAEAITLGKVVDECNRLRDLEGLSGDWHSGYRTALLNVTQFILAELRGK